MADSDFDATFSVSSSGLVCWVDMFQAASYGTTAAWNDIATADNDITQGTAGNQPVLSGTAGVVSGGDPPHRIFDGTSDYMHQKIFDTEQGALTFVADGGTAEFRDAGQDFSDWETTSGNAVYMIVVTSDNGTSWGYMGASNNGGLDIDVYDDLALTSRGWLTRTTPQGDGDTPLSYEVRKSDFQITGDLTVIAWVKTASAVGDYILNKADQTLDTRAFGLRIAAGGVISLLASINGTAFGVGASGTNDLQDDKWHMVGGVVDTTATDGYVYEDGSLVGTDGSGIASIYDTYDKLLVGARIDNSTIKDYWNGEIAEVIVFSRALSAGEILTIYDADQKRYGFKGGKKGLNLRTGLRL